MFTICNNYGKVISVAFMWYTPNCPDGGDFTKKGWWNLNPGQCVKVFNQNLASINRYDYVYARSTDGKEWSGNLIRAAPNAAFEWCEWVSGSQSQDVGFQRVDIGNNDDFTLTITP